MEPELRTITTIEEALALIDEWTAYARELEGQLARLDHAWRLKHRAAEMEMHGVMAELCDLIAATHPLAGRPVTPRTLPPRLGTAARRASPFDS